MENHTSSLLPAVFAALLAGMGTLLASEEKLTWRIVLGRALSSAALGAAAGTVFLWFPNAPTAALVGVAASLASLGTSGLEKLLQLIAKK